MSESEWTRFDYCKRPEIAEAGLPIAYTLPFSWGSFKVTEAADEQFGFFPLTPNTIRGDEDVAVTPLPLLPRVDFHLVGPNEFGGLEEEDMQHVGIRGRTQLHKKGLAHIITFTGSNELMAEDVINSIKEIMDWDDEDLEQNLEGDEDFTLPEILEKELPKAQLHMMLASIAERNREATISWMRMNNNKRIFRATTASGVMALAGAGLYYGVVLSTTGEFSGRQEAIDAGIAGSIVAVSLMIARSRLKRELGQSDLIEESHGIIADNFSNGIASGLHEIYCSDHFDRRIEEMLDQVQE